MTPTSTLSSSARRALRAAAHHLDPVVMIGGDGLTDAVKKETHLALNAHGLIKVRDLGATRCGATATAAMADTSAKELLVRFNPGHHNRLATTRAASADVSHRRRRREASEVQPTTDLNISLTLNHQLDPRHSHQVRRLRHKASSCDRRTPIRCSELQEMEARRVRRPPVHFVALH